MPKWALLSRFGTQYRGGPNSGPQVSIILFLLLLTISASTCLKNSRNLGPTFWPNPVYTVQTTLLVVGSVVGVMKSGVGDGGGDADNLRHDKAQKGDDNKYEEEGEEED